MLQRLILRLRYSAEEVVVLSILIAIASMGRVLFVGIPSVQPASFVIIMTGIYFGPKSGIVAGVLTAVLSNLFLGFGPWLPGQMAMWGGMGALAGMFSWVLKKHTLYRYSFAFVWGFLFGWGMNAFMFRYFGSSSFFAACIASIPLDLSHALGNVAFLRLAGKRTRFSLLRIREKYGLFS